MKIHPEVRRWFTGVMGNGGSPEMAADDQGAQGISNIRASSPSAPLPASASGR